MSVAKQKRITKLSKSPLPSGGCDFPQGRGDLSKLSYATDLSPLSPGGFKWCASCAAVKASSLNCFAASNCTPRRAEMWKTRGKHWEQYKPTHTWPARKWGQKIESVKPIEVINFDVLNWTPGSTQNEKPSIWFHPLRAESQAAVLVPSELTEHDHQTVDMENGQSCDLQSESQVMNWYLWAVATGLSSPQTHSVVH